MGARQNFSTHPIADTRPVSKVSLMKQPPKTPRKEPLLFACLIAWLGVAGFLYEYFHDTFPKWQVVGAVVGFMALGYVAYLGVLRALKN